MSAQHRPSLHLKAASEMYPDAWKFAEMCRQDRGKDLPNWPEWCFCPMAGWYAAACDDLQVQRLSSIHVPDVARLAALGAWRYTQSIYRINEHLRSELTQCPPQGALPVELLMRMPEWCVYIETPGQQFGTDPLAGFFANLEWDANTGRSELRLVMDIGNESQPNLLPVVLHLGDWTITEAVDRAASESKRQAGLINTALSDQLSSDFVQLQSEQLYPLISLLLYVCSDGVEYRAEKHRPENPQPKKTKKYGWRLYPASHPRVWNLGDKIGGQIQKISAADGIERTGPRPHIRRAHWHKFYAGPRDNEREVRIKWIPPTPVAMPE